MYDSKFSGSELSSSLTHQLAEVYKTLKTQEDDVTSLAVQIPPVQQQNGSNDCGLFAIAFALHAALGDNVEELEFDQSKMRDHIQKCFGKKYLDPFSTTSKKSKRSNHFPVREIELFCTCEMPQTYDDMVECEQCDNWFHLSCVGLSNAPNNSETWLCKSCS